MKRQLTRTALRTGALAATLALAIPATAAAFEPRVPDDFFGISAPALPELAKQTDGAALERHVSGIEAAGIGWARVPFDWHQLEPLVPVGDLHIYKWSYTDRLVASLARHGISAVPLPWDSPLWARDLDSILAGCDNHRAAVDPIHAPRYREFVNALMNRYGREGAFWSLNPQLPYKPVERVELWNEPNLGGYWCPRPDPEALAPVLAAGARGARDADPDATVTLGGLVLAKENMSYPNGALRVIETGSFISRLVAAEPSLPGLLDAVGIHLYEPNPQENLSMLGWLRRQLEAAGLGTSELLVTEFGWSTSGPGSVTEAQRAEHYRGLVAELPRTDCSISGIAAHDWASPEANPANFLDWFGIADPTTGELYPSGEAYVEQIDLYEGRGPTPAPRELIAVCGAEPPDQDQDGTPDTDDDYPLDPDQQTGANEPPPPTDQPPPEPRVRPARVADEFFGVTNSWLPLDSLERQPHYDAIADTVRHVREYLEWRDIEDPWLNHRWSDTDRRILGLARRGLRILPASINPRQGVPTEPAAAANAYAEFVGALVRRYGRGGAFWDENRHLDSSLAPREWEVWSAGNSTRGAWDGSPSPAEYAATYARTRAEILEIDPGARAIASLDDGGAGGSAEAFLRDMVAARPQLAGSIDGLYVMTGSADTAAEVEATAARVRQALDATGNSGARLYLGFGAPTQGAGSMSEAARVSFYSEVASRLPRGDCGVSGVFAFSWASAQADPANRFEWFGIASLADATPTATAAAYREAVRGYLGYAANQPSREALHPCSRPAPDSDGDGVPDPVDEHPLDPSQGQATQQPPPAPHLDTKPDGLIRVTWATFHYSAAGASGYQCRLDGESFHACPAPGLDYFPLDDGQHTFRVRAVDSLGLVGAETSYTWTVDTRPPQTTINGPTTVVGGSATFELRSDEPNSTFWCQYGSQPWAECPTTLTLTGLAPSSYQVQAVARDAAGNQDGSPAVHTFDVEAPPDPGPDPDPDPDPDPASGVVEVEIVKPPRRTADRTPTIRFAVSHAGAVAECSVDGRGWARCRSPYTTRRLKRGRHLVAVRAKHASATSPQASARFRVVKRKR